MIDRMETVGREVTLRAGELIRSSIGNLSSLDVRNKDPFDYVTNVDQESEALIIEGIRRHFPDHNIMAEESSHGALKDGVTWIIDPLDGTTNFIHGFPFVAVSIGVYMDGAMELGFVLDPVRGELFFARRGGGAFLNGKRIRARVQARVEDALLATGFPFRSKNILDPFMEAFKYIFSQVSGVRRAGAAALDLAYVAGGRVDGFWEVGLKTWDVAAGALLVKEAGGRVSDFWGTDDYLENGHIVAGVDAVYPLLMDAVGTFLAPALRPGQG